MQVDTSLSADIGVVCGSSGSGKSVVVKKALAKARRAIVWDIDDEYTGDKGVPGMQRVASMAELAKKLGAAKAGKFAYVGKKSDFDAWCRLVFAWGHCAAVAEELAGVTSPGKAPDGWHTLVSRGRKRGISLIAVTQRPAESDKTVMGNASFMRVGRLARAQDRKYMAAEIDVPEATLSGLRNLEYVIKNMADNEYLAGKIVIPKNGAKSLTNVRIKETPLTIDR